MEWYEIEINGNRSVKFAEIKSSTNSNSPLVLHAASANIADNEGTFWHLLIFAT